MTIKYCDACGDKIPNLNSNKVKVNNEDPRDLCAKCTDELRSILINQRWRVLEDIRK